METITYKIYNGDNEFWGRCDVLPLSNGSFILAIQDTGYPRRDEAVDEQLTQIENFYNTTANVILND
jgi:hypothetical protein